MDLEKIVEEVRSGKKKLGYIPNELWRNKEFVMLLCANLPTGYKIRDITNKIFWKIPEELRRDLDVLIPYLKSLKGIYYSEEKEPNSKIRKYCINNLGEEVMQNNAEVWLALDAAGLTTLDDRVEKIDKSVMAARKKRYLDSLPADEVYEAAEGLIKEYDLDSEYIYGLIEKDARCFRFLPPPEKASETVRAKVKGINPKVKTEIEMYDRKRDLAANKHQAQATKHTATYNANHPKGRKTNSKHEEYLSQKQEHPDVQIILDFLTSLKSRKAYCKSKKISEDDFEKLVNEVGKVFPKLKEAVEYLVKKYKDAFAIQAKRYIVDICSGKITIESFAKTNWGSCKVEQLLGFADESQKVQLKKKIFEAMNSGTLSMMDLVRLFSVNFSIPSVENQIKKFFDSCEMTIDLEKRQKVQSQVKKMLEEHKVPFRTKEFYGLAYSAKFVDEDGNQYEKTMEVTSNEVRLAIMLVRSRDGYLCKKTINDALKEILRGNVNASKIESQGRLYKGNAMDKRLRLELDLSEIRIKIDEILLGAFEVSDGEK